MRLKPRDVLAWARRSGAVSIPAKLQEGLAKIEAAPGNAKDAEDMALLPAPRADGTRGTSKRWTPEELAELRSYKAAHGTKATAERFNISQARVRKLVPTEPEKAAAGQPHSVWTHRPR